MGDREDSPARVAAISALAAKRMFDGDYAATIELVNEVLPAAERLGPAEDRVRLLNLRGNARGSRGDEGGFEDLERSIDLASEAHAYEQLHSSLNNLMTRQVALGRLDEARRSFGRMLENHERHGTHHRLGWVLNIEADLNYMEGNWQEATRLLEAFIAESEASAAHYLDPVSRYLRGSIRLASGDRAGASADLERALDVARKSGEGQILCAVLIGEATMLLDEGRRAEAAALAAEALDFGERLVNILNDTVIVDAAWVMHDLGRGEEYVSLVDARPDLPWARAAAAICSGEFVQAAEELGRIGYRPGEAYARLRAAGKLVEEGRRAEADAELRRALAFWREVGATRYVREGEALLATSA